MKWFLAYSSDLARSSLHEWASARAHIPNNNDTIILKTYMITPPNKVNLQN